MEPFEPIEPPVDPDGRADPDLELLENYLDNELSPAEAHRVERRLSAEPDLSAALGRMSTEYALRQAAFRSLEPDKRAAEALAASFASMARRIDRSASRRHSLQLGRLAGALAACVILSFCAGWVGRGFAARAQAKAASAQANPSVDKDSKGEPSVYQVALTDEQGNITAVQKFDKLEEAQAFAADVGRWQARQQQVRQNTSVVMSSGL